MNLGTSLKSLEPQFPHLQEGDNVTSLACSHLVVVRSDEDDLHSNWHIVSVQ